LSGSPLGYTKNDQPSEAIEIFTGVELQQLLQAKTSHSFAGTRMDVAESTMVIYLCAVTTLADLAMSDMAEDIVKQIPSNFLAHLRIRNALIDMWVSEHA
jgi:hypothetical protein